MIGSTIAHALVEVLEVLRLVRGAEQLASVLYAFSTPIGYGRPIFSRYSLISVRPPNASTNAASSHGL